MPSRVVWYPAGSGLGRDLAGLGGDLLPRPFPEQGPGAPGPGEGAVLLVDARPGHGDPDAEARACAAGIPVVALVDQGAVAGACGGYYASLPRSAPDFVLAQTLRN